MLATKEVIHIADLATDQAYIERSNPRTVEAVELGGVRTVLAVPMLKENELIGSFTLCRQEVRPFIDKQIALVASFSAQAVIAIENARLLNELRQRTDELGRSVGELRTLGEVSQAVNSTLDIETVLSTIVAKAVQLSGTDAGAIYVFDELEREFRLRATYGMDQELIDALRQQHIGMDEPNVERAFAEGEPIQVADLREDAPSPANEIVLRAGYRERLAAPGKVVRGPRCGVLCPRHGALTVEVRCRLVRAQILEHGRKPSRPRISCVRTALRLSMQMTVCSEHEERHPPKKVEVRVGRGIRMIFGDTHHDTPDHPSKNHKHRRAEAQNGRFH